MSLLSLVPGGAPGGGSPTPATKYIQFNIIEQATDCAADTGVGLSFEMPFAGSIVGIGAYAAVAGVTGTQVVDVNKNGSSILSVKISLDSTERSSRTAATPAVLSDNTLAKGDFITFDIDSVHSGTAAKGLTVWLEVV